MAVRSSCGVVCLAALAACSAGNNSVDPGDLELRDLLGISPGAASAWDAAQRSAARRVLAEGLGDDDALARHAPTAAPGDSDALARPAPTAAPGDDDARADPASRRALANADASRRALSDGPGSMDERVAAWLASNDAARAAEGAGPLGIVAVAIDAHDLAVASPRRGPLAAAALGGAPSPAHGPGVELRLAGSWDAGGRDGALTDRDGALTDRDGALLTALAADAGHPGGPLVVVPAPQLVVIAAYVRRAGETAPPRLAVNPVALAALEPIAGVAAATSAIASPTSIRRGIALGSPGGPPPATATQLAGSGPGAGSTPVIGSTPVGGSTPVASTGGNPYSFYGSVAECAFAQRTRCEACLPAGICRPITSITDGNAECTMLGADDGRGYFLLCINLSLAIAAVDRCTGDAAPSCVRDSRAADSLATLDNNASFLTDPTCGSALDGCLASLFGPPGDSFPGLDGGAPPAAPPRSTSVSCSNSCNNDPNIRCNASPSCDCSGPSCNNTLSCDSACSSSNDQSGCGGNCNACSSSGGGGGGGGCGGGSSSSGGGCSSGSGSSSGGGCSSGSGGGGGCSGNGCSGSGSSCGSGGSCNGGSGGSCGGGGGGGGKCSVAPVDPAPGVGLAMSAIWGCLPVVLAGLTRRRARRRSSRTAASEDEATEETTEPTRPAPGPASLDGEPPARHSEADGASLDGEPPAPSHSEADKASLDGEPAAPGIAKPGAATPGGNAR